MVTVQTPLAKLTSEQIAFYEAFGFVVLRHAFSGEEMKIIDREFEALGSKERQGQSFSGQEDQVVHYLIEHLPDFTRLSQRVNDAAEQLLGSGYYFAGTGANLYVAETGWHADLGWHPSMLGGRPAPPGNFYRGVKVGMYLDPVTRNTGCLRVIPASHMMPNPILDLLAPTQCDMPGNFSADGTIKRFGIPPSEVPCHAIDSEPGDLVFFSHQVWHGAFGGKTGRRLIALNYKAKPTTDDEHEYIRKRAELKRQAQVRILP